jgi:hypothetical protein
MGERAVKKPIVCEWGQNTATNDVQRNTRTGKQTLPAANHGFPFTVSEKSIELPNVSLDCAEAYPMHPNRSAAAFTDCIVLALHLPKLD